MIVEKTGNFLRPDQVRDGDVLEILSEGTLAPSSFSDREQLVIDVRLPNGDTRRWAPNGTTRNAFIDAWGNNTANWIGKKCRVKKVRQNVRGTERDVIYATPVEGGAQ